MSRRVLDRRLLLRWSRTWLSWVPGVAFGWAVPHRARPRAKFPGRPKDASRPGVTAAPVNTWTVRRKQRRLEVFMQCTA